MTAKEKAEKLLRDYLIYFPEYYNDLEYDYNVEKAKRCALIAVDEIIKETKLHDKTIYQHGRTAYWQEVKQEIEKL
jgi:hypothetical protein